MAGYRDTSGNWLARPTQPFGRYGKAHRCSEEEKREEEEEEDKEKEEEALGTVTGKRDSGGSGDSSAGSGASVLFVRESKLIQVRLYCSPPTPPHPTLPSSRLAGWFVGR